MFKSTLFNFSTITMMGLGLTVSENGSVFANDKASTVKYTMVKYKCRTPGKCGGRRRPPPPRDTIERATTAQDQAILTQAVFIEPLYSSNIDSKFKDV